MVGKTFLDLVGIDLPQCEGVKSASTPIEAVRTALGGYVVDYSIMPNPLAQIRELMRIAHAEPYSTETMVELNHSAEARTLLSIIQYSSGLYIDLSSKPTPMLEAALQSMLLDREACKYVRTLTIAAPGWANFMQQVYDAPSLFPALDDVLIQVPLPDGEPDTFIPVRARVLQLYCGTTFDRTESDKWTDFIITTINRAECKRLLVGSIRTDIDTARIVNTYIKYVSIRTDTFVADLPNLNEVDIGSSGLRVFDGGRYPKLRYIWVSDMTLDEYVNILRTTPSLTSFPGTTYGVKQTPGDLLDTVREHAPHLFEYAKYPFSYRWTPRMHGAFENLFGALIAAYVIGAQRLSDTGSCAAFDPAAFEETIRHLAINDR